MISEPSRRSGAALFMAIAVSAPLVMAQRAEASGRGVDVQRKTAVMLYRPRARVVETCRKTEEEVPEFLMEECMKLHLAAGQRKSDVLEYSRVVLGMERAARGGGEDLAKRFMDGRAITRREYESIRHYVLELEVARGRINEDNRRMAKLSVDISWYLKSHYRPGIARAGAIVRDGAAAHQKAVKPERIMRPVLGGGEWKRDAGIRIDGRVLEVCRLPSLYMLPLNVFADCAKLSASLGRPGIIPYYNSREAQLCSAYGYSQDVPLEEKRRIIARALARYKERVPDRNTIQKLESSIMQFYNPGRESVEEGLERCPHYRPLSFYLGVIAAVAIVFYLGLRLLVYSNAKRR